MLRLIPVPRDHSWAGSGSEMGSGDPTKISRGQDKRLIYRTIETEQKSPALPLNSSPLGGQPALGTRPQRAAPWRAPRGSLTPNYRIRVRAGILRLPRGCSPSKEGPALSRPPLSHSLDHKALVRRPHGIAGARAAGKRPAPCGPSPRAWGSDHERLVRPRGLTCRVQSPRWVIPGNTPPGVDQKSKQDKNS